MVRMKSEPQFGVSVVLKAQTIKANNSLTQLNDLNTHLKLENSVITEDFIQKFSNKTPQPVFFKRLHDFTLSRSQYRVSRYSPVNSDQPIMYEEKSQTQSFHKSLAECIEEVKLISALVTNSHSQFISDEYSSADEQEPQRSKRSLFGSIFKWLFGGLGSTDKSVQ